MDAVQHRDVIVKLVVDTTEQLDIDGWEASHGAATAQGYSRGGGQAGAQYRFSLIADSGTHPEADTQQVIRYWESLDMETRVADHGGFSAVYATGGPVQRATLTPLPPVIAIGLLASPSVA